MRSPKDPPVTPPRSETSSHSASTACPHTAVVGLQWGDEGKGKIVDLFARDHDFVVRYNGGANAGHSIVVGDQRYAVHLIPSGVFYPGKVCVIGNGVVVDPEQLLKEIDTLNSRGIAVTPANLKISDRAHVVLPWHKTLDAALENLLASHTGADGAGRDSSIGTTRRGIGPAYADKITRATAIRMGDLLDEAHLAERIRMVAAIKNAQLQAFDPHAAPIDVDALVEQQIEFGRRLRSHVSDTTYLLHDALRAGRRLLFEGANACLLDVDHGTFPYVTSSSTSALGIPAGTGVPGRHVQRVVGIMKAYTTRVGGGPFPTELLDETGDYIRRRGHEYGTTTGRPRRCGWLDLVAVRYSAMLSGATSLAVMLFDVLAGLDELRVCTAYRVASGEAPSDRFIPDAHRLARLEPVYETLPGFRNEIAGVTEYARLPDAARRYLDRIAEFVAVPIEIVSVGPERTQTLHV